MILWYGISAVLPSPSPFFQTISGYVIYFIAVITTNTRLPASGEQTISGEVMKAITSTTNHFIKTPRRRLHMVYLLYSCYCQVIVWVLVFHYPTSAIREEPRKWRFIQFRKPLTKWHAKPRSLILTNNTANLPTGRMRRCIHDKPVRRERFLKGRFYVVIVCFFLFT